MFVAAGFGIPALRKRVDTLCLSLDLSVCQSDQISRSLGPSSERASERGYERMIILQLATAARIGSTMLTWTPVTHNVINLRDYWTVGGTVDILINVLKRRDGVSRRREVDFPSRADC